MTADLDEIFVSYRPAPRRWLAALAVVTTVLLLFALVYGARWVLFRPAAVVADYFAALRDRDAAAALRTVEPGLELDQHPLLDPAVLWAAEYAPPERAMVTSTAVAGRRAVATVELVLGPDTRTVRMELRRLDGFADRLWHRWRIVGGTGELTIAGWLPAVTVNGVDLPEAGQPAIHVLRALPGRYEVAGPGTPLWSVSSAVGWVAPGGAVSADPVLAPAPALRAETNRQLGEHLDACAGSADLAPPGCPFRYGWVAGAADITWTVLTVPGYRLSVEPGGGADSAGRPQVTLTGVSPGVAEVRGTSRTFGSDPVPFEDRVEFGISGTVSERDGGIVVEFS